MPPGTGENQSDFSDTTNVLRGATAENNTKHTLRGEVYISKGVEGEENYSFVGCLAGTERICILGTASERRAFLAHGVRGCLEACFEGRVWRSFSGLAVMSIVLYRNRKGSKHPTSLPLHSKISKLIGYLCKLLPS